MPTSTSTDQNYLPSHFHPQPLPSPHSSPPAESYLYWRKLSVGWKTLDLTIALNIFLSFLISFVMCGSHVTLVLQLGQLLAQRVVALLQEPLLLLHTLHVLGQRADLCLMLHKHNNPKLMKQFEKYIHSIEISEKTPQLISLFFFTLIGFVFFHPCHCLTPHLRDEELAGGELPPSLLHLAVTLQLHVLQLAAAFHHALHL